jgi:ATP-binding cassette ChvD family protein
VQTSLKEWTSILHEYEDISAQFALELSDDQMTKLLDRQAQLLDLIDAHDLWNLDRKIDKAMIALNLPSNDSDVSKLSGGECRRVALARLLLSEPDVLLLDEPTNHLDALSVAWLERFLKEFKGTVIAVTHDRYFLDNVAGWILELDRGHGYPYQGNYTTWLNQRNERLRQEKAQQAAHQKAVEEELDWVRAGSSARQKKSKARLQNFHELAAKEFQERAETSSLYIPPGPRLGQNALILENINKSFGSKKLIDNLSFNVPAGAVVGIIGPNGVGKSTLFKIIAGQDKPDSGTINLGATTHLAYVDQSRDQLNDQKTVWEEISDGLDYITVGQYVTPSRAYVGRFNFSGSDQQKIIGNLSGGERNRVHLAKLLRSGGNFLLLDEPTNDLDVETLRALEQAINNFPGSAMIISHDRWFLDRVATHILAFNGDGSTRWFEGNFTEYAEYYDIDTVDGKKNFKYTKID